MKWDTGLLIAAAALLIAVAIITPAYASNQAATYNEGNNANMQYITVGVGETEYSGAFDNTVEYKVKTVIDSSIQGGRTTVYEPQSTGSIVYNESTIQICELGILNLTVSSSEALSSYDVLIKGVEGTMTGTFYLRYWLDPPQNLDTGNAAPDGVCPFSTTTGCTFNVQPAAAKIVVSLCLAAENVNSITPALDDVSFMVSVIANGGSP